MFISRERQIQEIEASFEACKARPVHATNRKLQPVEILPLFPDFDRYIFSTFNLCQKFYCKPFLEHVFDQIMYILGCDFGLGVCMSP